MKRMPVKLKIFLVTLGILVNPLIVDAGTRANKREQVYHDASKNLTNVVTFKDLVNAHGYESEAHNVTTDDGYILTVHRLLNGSKNSSNNTRNKPVVLFIHGLLAASDIWVIRGPDQDLAFMLIDAGYDIWFLNVRGNYYSKRHKKLLPNKDGKFWRFSWHEAGYYDMSAVIDYILKKAGQSKLSLIGHSMGATMQLVLLSMKPEYNSKVNVVVCFAPVAIFTHILPGPIGPFAIRYGKQIQKTLSMLGLHEILPRSSSLVGIYKSFCQAPGIEMVCQQLVMLLGGLTRTNYFDAIDTSVIRKAMHHYPQGTSVDTLLHYRQIMMTGKFRQYDFGAEGNLIRYKNARPPEYPLDKIKVPVILYYGMNDAYTTREDVMALKQKLKNAEVRLVPHKLFGHLDFLLNNSTKSLVYDDVVNIVEYYNDQDRFNNVSLTTILPIPENEIEDSVDSTTPIGL